MRPLIPLLILAALAACNAPERSAAPAVPATTADEQVEAAITVPVEPEIPPPLPTDKPAVPGIPLDRLIGLEDDMVTALIGQPALREDRAPAVVWVYEASTCRFGLLLYPDLETSDRTVLSYETDQPDSCTADMVMP